MRVVSYPAFFWREEAASSGEGGIPPLGWVPYLPRCSSANAAKAALRCRSQRSKNQTKTDARTAAPRTARAGAKKRASMIRSFGCCILILPRPTPQVNPGACASVHSPPCVRARVPGLTCTLPRGTMGDDPHERNRHDSSPSLRRPCRRPRFGLGLFVVCALLASAAPLAAGLIPSSRASPRPRPRRGRRLAGPPPYHRATPSASPACALTHTATCVGAHCRLLYFRLCDYSTSGCAIALCVLAHLPVRPCTQATLDTRASPW